MNIHWTKIVLLVGVAVILIQCTPVDFIQMQNGTQLPATQDGNPAEPTTWEPVNNMNDEHKTPDSSNRAAPGLQNLIDMAKEDLAQRLSISPSQISLVEARDVVWPDGSLGCPQPGMQYPQVLTSGVLIRLAASVREYEYHGSRETVLYCENPMPPVSGTPLDQ